MTRMEKSPKKLTRNFPVSITSPGDTSEERKRKIDTYNAVADAAQLISITLLRANFDVKDDYILVLQNAGKDGKSVNFSFDDEVEEVIFDSDSGLAQCNFIWTLSVRSERRKVLTICAAFRVLYKNLEGKDSDAVGKFVRRIGRVATYPYFRSFAGQLSWLANADLPILPVIQS